MTKILQARNRTYGSVTTGIVQLGSRPRRESESPRRRSCRCDTSSQETHLFPVRKRPRRGGCPHPPGRAKLDCLPPKNKHVGTAALGCPVERSSARSLREIQHHVIDQSRCSHKCGNCYKGGARPPSCARPDSRGRLYPRSL